MFKTKLASYCTGREVILEVFSSLNNTEAVRRIVANERTMASLSDYSLRNMATHHTVD